jgi:enoyl-CoA hydratase/carnithine racemase/methionyl-tRNA formyltransferase
MVLWLDIKSLRDWAFGLKTLRHDFWMILTSNFLTRHTKMKILFLTTAHNSLSQRLYLALSQAHEITVEYALSDTLMITAAQLAQPDIIICPFLTSRVPKEVYNKYLTLIVHPGPPGDAGPSALDWLLMGDDGLEEDATKALKSLDQASAPGRSHWGVTVLQAIEQLDAGPVWAFEQFPVNIDQHGLSKSELYRGPVSRSAISACITAVNRIQRAAGISAVSPSVVADLSFKQLSVKLQLPFQGGKTCDRPLLKANQREFDPSKHTAQQISRRIRSGDSQPGSMSSIFGQKLYIYGGIVEECPEGPNAGAFPAASPGTIVATRNEAVCIATADGLGVWITHVRRPKRAQDTSLWPKVPAVFGLLQLGILQPSQLRRLDWELPNDWSKSPFSTLQEVWVDFVSHGPEQKRVAYVYFDFYNGAMSTAQCSYLIEAFEYVLGHHTTKTPIAAVVLMGGSYFSNGIHLNTIESSSNPAQESWLNINRIDDVVFYLLHKFPSASITTIAAMRGNAAAGGVALGTACDVVIAGADITLNPAYRGVGLYGSEYHTLSYNGRCGPVKGREILRSMTPLSPFDARSIGLVDHVFPGTGLVLDKRIRNHVAVIARSGSLGRVKNWKTSVDLSLGNLAVVRAAELGEMALDFWSARSERYHSRRFAFVRKVKSKHTPFRFAQHRRGLGFLDEEEKDEFDSVQHYERLQRDQMILELQQALEASQQKLEQASHKLEVFAEPQKRLKISQPVGDTMFSCYYSSPELTTTPPYGMSSASSNNGTEIK